MLSSKCGIDVKRNLVNGEIIYVKISNLCLFPLYFQFDVPDTCVMFYLPKFVVCSTECVIK